MASEKGLGSKFDFSGKQPQDGKGTDSTDTLFVAAKKPGFSKLMKQKTDEIKKRKNWTKEQWADYNAEQAQLAEESRNKFFN